MRNAKIKTLVDKIRTFAILTPENPEGQDISAEQNNKLLAQFKGVMKRGNVPCYPIEGRYEKVKEQSFLLINISLRGVTNYAQI